MSINHILARTPVASIQEAIVAMQAIDIALPDADGVKWFNRLYLRVTESVNASLVTARFDGPAFLATLDVVFANLYFAALTAGTADIDAAPSSWRPLLRARHSPGITHLQFALAGMNAHINRDLPDGIVRSFVALGGDPITDTIREKDFNSVNDILERVEEEIKPEFTEGFLVTVDRVSGGVDDAVAMWKVRAARSAAWTNAQVLWVPGGLPSLRDRFFAKLDSLVGLTGQGLLQHRDPAVLVQAAASRLGIPEM